LARSRRCAAMGGTPVCKESTRTGIGRRALREHTQQRSASTWQSRLSPTFVPVPTCSFRPALLRMGLLRGLALWSLSSGARMLSCRTGFRVHRDCRPPPGARFRAHPSRWGFSERMRDDQSEDISSVEEILLCFILGLVWVGFITPPLMITLGQARHGLVLSGAAGLEFVGGGTRSSTRERSRRPRASKMRSGTGRIKAPRSAGCLVSCLLTVVSPAAVAAQSRTPPCSSTRSSFPKVEFYVSGTALSRCIDMVGAIAVAKFTMYNSLPQATPSPSAYAGRTSSPEASGRCSQLSRASKMRL
jgi:hypothetical protein